MSADKEEHERLARVAETRARNVDRLRQEWGDLSNEEVIAEVVPAPAHVEAPLVMTLRLIAAIGQLEGALKRSEKLAWALVGLTVVLLIVTAVLALRS